MLLFQIFSARGLSRIAALLLWLVPLALLSLIGFVFVTALNAGSHAGAQPPSAASGGFPRTITESDGRSVVIPARPLRILPANAGSADIVAALVEPSRIAALPQSVEKWAGAVEFYTAHAEIPRFEKYLAEPLLALKPDLILCMSYQDAATTKILEEHQIPVLHFDAYKTFAGIRGSILAVGSAVGEDDKAQLLAADFDRRLKTIEMAVASLKKPRALCYSNFGEGYAVGTGESQDEVLRRAGATNAAAEMNLSGHVRFSFEQMLKLNPDWLVVGENQTQVLLNEPALAELPAIKQRHIAVVPDRYFSSVSQYVVEAVEILAKQIHPELAADGPK